jgi:glycine/D-amino acid oxidase-like deaminating enzyme
MAALAYHGGGVALATAFGRAAASLLAGQPPDPPLPGFLSASPPRFPWPATRRYQLKAAYIAYRLADARG